MRAFLPGSARGLCTAGGLPRLSLAQLRQRPFVMIGPNVIESEDHALRTAAALRSALDRFDATFIFKASFDKANRTSSGSYRGVSIERAARLFERVRSEFGVPVVTDVHEPHQPAMLAHCVDVMQIPAFLCRCARAEPACRSPSRCALLPRTSRPTVLAARCLASRPRLPSLMPAVSLQANRPDRRRRGNGPRPADQEGSVRVGGSDARAEGQGDGRWRGRGYPLRARRLLRVRASAAKCLPLRHTHTLRDAAGTALSGSHWHETHYGNTRGGWEFRHSSKNTALHAPGVALVVTRAEAVPLPPSGITTLWWTLATCAGYATTGGTIP